MGNMFAPLTPHEKTISNDPSSNRDIGTAVIPIPNELLLDIPKHPILGIPSTIWEYRNAAGQPIQLACRFTQDEKKEDRPLTFRTFSDGSCKWCWKALDAPRPLYGLDRLEALPNAPVIVCEGEKATDAAQKLFPTYVVVTSPNGSNAAHKANWNSLNGRNIIIWPDNDEAGKLYAKNVAHLVKKIGTQSVKIVTIPQHFPDKWDLADTLPENYTPNDLELLINNAKAAPNPLDNIVERAKNDSSVVYDPEVIKELLTLKNNDRQQYMSLRLKLKNAGVGITLLEEDLKKLSCNNNSGAKPDHLDYAREVIDYIGQNNIICSNDNIWIWSKTGAWEKAPDRQIKQCIQKTLESSSCKIFRTNIDSIAEILKNEIYAPEHRWNANHDAVNVSNGELYWNGSIWELEPHSKEHYSTVQLPVIYDINATCPRFTKFLDEIFMDDKDSKDKATALLEMLGYTLMSNARYERFALLIGSGANGKSVILEVLLEIVGKHNIAAVQPSKLSNSFQRAHLHMKLANLVTEIAEGGQIADAELKAITSGELATAEHKGKDPFDFAPFCTCWFGSNHMPHTRDFSDALFRRALVIPFNNKFEGKKADPNLKDKLKKECSGILNLALSAFGEVLKRGTFTEPQSCLEAKKDWRTEADQVAQFIEDKCVFEPNSKLLSSALYNEYRSWTTEVGIKSILKQRSFTNRLLHMDCKLHKGTGGKRMITGIRIGWKTT